MLSTRGGDMEFLAQIEEETNGRFDNVYYLKNHDCLGYVSRETSGNNNREIHLDDYACRTKGYREKTSAISMLNKYIKECINETKSIYWRVPPKITEDYDFDKDYMVYYAGCRFSTETSKKARQDERRKDNKIRQT